MNLPPGIQTIPSGAGPGAGLGTGTGLTFGGAVSFESDVQAVLISAAISIAASACCPFIISIKKGRRNIEEGNGKRKRCVSSLFPLPTSAMYHKGRLRCTRLLEINKPETLNGYARSDILVLPCQFNSFC